MRSPLTGIILIIMKGLCCIVIANDIFVSLDISTSDPDTRDTLICNKTTEYNKKITRILFLDPELTDPKSINVSCYCVLSHQENNTKLQHLRLSLQHLPGLYWDDWVDLTSVDWENTEYGIPKFYIAPDIQEGAKLVIFRQSGNFSTTHYTLMDILGVQNKVILRCSPDGYPYEILPTTSTAHITSKTLSSFTQSMPVLPPSSHKQPTLHSTDSNNSTLTTVALGDDTDGKGTDTIVIIIGVVIGVALATLIIAVVIVILVVRHKKSHPQNLGLTPYSYDTAIQTEHNNGNNTETDSATKLQGTVKELTQPETSRDNGEYSYAYQNAANQVVEYERADGVQYAQINTNSLVLGKNEQANTNTGEGSINLTYADLDLKEGPDSFVNYSKINQAKKESGSDINDNRNMLEQKDTDVVQVVYAQPMKKNGKKDKLDFNELKSNSADNQDKHMSADEKSQVLSDSAGPKESKDPVDLSELYAQPIKKKK